MWNRNWKVPCSLSLCLGTEGVNSDLLEEWWKMMFVVSSTPVRSVYSTVHSSSNRSWPSPIQNVCVLLLDLMNCRSGLWQFVLHHLECNELPTTSLLNDICVLTLPMADGSTTQTVQMSTWTCASTGSKWSSNAAIKLRQALLVHS